MTDLHAYKGKRGMLEHCLDKYPNWRRHFESVNGRPPHPTDIDELEIHFGNWLGECGWPGIKPTDQMIADRNKYGQRSFQDFMADKLKIK